MKTKLTLSLSKFSNENLLPSISDRRRFLEILAASLTAIGKFVFMDFLGFRLYFVLFAILAWSSYIYYSYKQDNNILKYWGFRFDNSKVTLKLILPFSLFALISFVIIGCVQNSIRLNWHILPILITYPFWGIIQQFLTMALIACNLNHIKRFKFNKVLIIIITAVLFSVVHYPSLWLMIGTFFLALFYGFIYLKVQNIYILGVFHGWLGAFFYYVVLGQDPFQDIFLKIFA